MPVALTSDPESEPPATSVTSISGGVNFDAQRDVTIGGDVVGRDKITVGYTVEQVSTLLTQISNTFQPKPFDGCCPYLGLDAFSEDDADRFFGRETLVSELVGRAKESRFVVIAGPSGSGKSSLVRAGLIHALRQGALLNSDRWLYTTLTPGRDPIESLALAMSRLVKSPDAGDYVRGHKTEADALHKFAESQLSDRNDQRAVIFVDQFEEVFTQISKEDERLAFLNLLTHAATTAGGRVTVLFALRSDFVSNFATYPQLNALLNQQFMQVGAMQPDELVSAIARPALQVGLRIDPDLIAQIVNDMQDEPGALPLMQFALKDLFDAQQAKGGVIALTLSDYLARGGLRKALERHADAAFAKLSEDEQQLARSIFSGLIEIGRGTQDTRRTANFDELVPANVDATQVKAVVQKLADARLIATDERDHQATVAIAHETLIDAWPWLRKLINENREAISLQNQIAEDAREWDVHQHDASYLYSGARLATVREELATQQITLSELAQKFIEAGTTAFESARQGRQRIVRGIIGGLVIISIVFAGLSVWAVNSQQSALHSAANESAARGTAQANAAEAQRQADMAQAASTKAVSETNIRATAEVEALNQRDEAKRQAQIALARQLAVESQRIIERQPAELTRAVLLAIESLLRSSTIEGDQALDGGLSLLPREVSDLTHSGTVYDVAFSPDGQWVVSGSNDAALVWESASGREVARLTHDDGVLAVAFSPDGRWVVSGSHDDTARVWEAASGREVARVTHKSAVFAVAFSPDGQWVVSGGRDGTARVWEAASGREVAHVTHNGTVSAVAFSPDGQWVVSGSYDGTARVWEAASGREVARLTHNGAVSAVAFSPDGRWIATGSADGTARVWEEASGREVARLTYNSAVSTVAFSPDGQRVVSGGNDSTARVWEAASGREVARMTHDDAVLYAVAFSPDGKWVVSGSANSIARVWEAASGREVARLTHKSAVSAVAFSPDGQWVVSGSNDGTARVWEAASGREVARLMHKGAVRAVAFSPDGQWVVSGSDDAALVWEAVSGREVARLTHNRAVSAVAFSPDGQWVVSGSNDAALVWEAASGREVARLTHDNGVLAVAFSPDDRWVVSGGNDGTARVWEAASGREVARLTHDNCVLTVAFSPDGQWVVSGSYDGTARVWEAASGREVARLMHNGAVSAVAFSPDGQWVATGSYDGTARVWEATSGREVAHLMLDDAVHVVAFSPDGQWVVSGSWDKTARVWEVASGREVARLTHNGAVNAVTFSPNGRWIATGSDDGTARVGWLGSAQDLIELACTRLTRNLTQAEWQQYLPGDPYRQTCDNLPAGE